MGGPCHGAFCTMGSNYFWIQTHNFANFLFHKIYGLCNMVTDLEKGEKVQSMTIKSSKAVPSLERT